jgi:hypothetical protein
LSEDALLDDLFASAPSGGNSTAASGGASTAASGGDSTAVSGGNQSPGNFSGGGANSGVPRSMLTAGENSLSNQAGSAKNNSKDLHTYSQRDFRGAQVYNNEQNGAWLKLGPLPFQDCNDGDLAEWMVRHEIEFTCKR